MGNAYLIILKRVMVLAAVAASMWTVDAPVSVAGDSGPDASPYRNSQQNNEDAFGETAALPRPALAVGPGRVSFELTPYGRWLGLTPDWTDGRSVITRGGFVVLAVGQDGAVEELANTYNGAASRLRAREEARGLRPVHEGPSAMTTGTDGKMRTASTAWTTTATDGSTKTTRPSATR
jgi:hypothetical protein